MSEENIKRTKSNQVEEPAIVHFKYIRPHLIKLFTHAILLYLTVNAYQNFTQSEAYYSDFLTNLETIPLVTDIKLINSTETCESPYQDISYTTFPTIASGCRCDQNFYQTEVCTVLYDKIKNKPSSLDWSTNCAAQANATTTARLLSSNSFNYSETLPSDCHCYEELNGTSTEMAIKIWVSGKKFCIKYDNSTSTLDYLGTAMSTETCPEANLCQNYFCSSFNESSTSECPIVDVYFDHKKEEVNSKGKIVYVFDANTTNMYASTYYNKTFTNNATFENTILLPVMGMAITNSGKCVNGNNSVVLDFGLVDNIFCAKDPSYYSIDTESVSNLLSYNGYYNTLINNYPDFSLVLNNNIQWNLDLKYGFFRDSLTCLMESYDTINSNSGGYFSSLNQTSVSDYAYLKHKLANILYTFLKFKSQFNYQSNLQIVILAINCLVVLTSVSIVTYKIISYACNANKEMKFCGLEIYFSFIIELSLGILGGVSYFILNDYQNFLEAVIASGCVDNYVQYKFGIFAQALNDTGDQNFEIFLIILLKFLIMLFSMIYYSLAKKCKLDCASIHRIIKENLNEGEGENEQEDGEDEEEADLKNKDGVKDEEVKVKGAHENNWNNNGSIGKISLEEPVEKIEIENKDPVDIELGKVNLPNDVRKNIE